MNERPWEKKTLLLLPFLAEHADPSVELRPYLERLRGPPAGEVVRRGGLQGRPRTSRTAFPLLPGMQNTVVIEATVVWAFRP